MNTRFATASSFSMRPSDVIEVREQIAQELIEIDASELIEQLTCGRETSGNTRQRARVTHGLKILLHGNALLQQDGLDALGIVEARVRPDLFRQHDGMVEILRQHACGNDEFRRDALSERLVLVGGGGKTQTSQVELRERIDLGSSVVFGIELAEPSSRAA